LPRPTWFRHRQYSRKSTGSAHLNLAYRWFRRLGLDGEVPDHSTFSKNRHGCFRDCDLLRKLFETVVRRCIAEETDAICCSEPAILGRQWKTLPSKADVLKVHGLYECLHVPRFALILGMTSPAIS
jgi:hypothetical protein